MRGHRGDIQGLRALAVALVIANHFTGWPGGGFTGVDVFFVLSGFLITGLLLREYENTGRISFADFYRRRTRRLLPAAVLVLVVTTACAWLLFASGRARSTTVDALWALVFGANWRFAVTGTDYLNATGPLSPVQHFWSLAVEEQFYFVWPLLLLMVLTVAPRNKRRSPAIAITVVGSLSFCWALWETGANPTWAYFSSVSRVWELAVGALLAIAAPRLARLPAKARPFVAWPGLVLIFAGAVWIGPTSAFPAPLAIIPVVGTAMVIAAGVSGPVGFLWPLTNRAVGYVGDISYSLYLWHFPVYLFVGVFLAESPRRHLVVALAFTFVISVLSYHLVENKARRSSWLERPSSRRRWAVAAAVTAVATVSAVIFIPASPPAANTAAPAVTDHAAAIELALNQDTWPASLVPSLDDASSGTPYQITPPSGCLNPPTTDGSADCTFGNPASGKLALVVGDSVAMSWLPGIIAAIGDDYQIRGIGFSNCPFADVAIRLDKTPGDAERCARVHSTIYESIATIRPDLLIVSDVGLGLDRLATGASDSNAQREWESGMSSALGSVDDGAARIVVLSPPPETVPIHICATRFSRPTDCESPVLPVWQFKAQADRDAADTFGATYVDTSSWFCLSGRCPAFAGGMLVRTDGMHLTHQYSTSLGPVLSEALR